MRIVNILLVLFSFNLMAQNFSSVDNLDKEILKLRSNLSEAYSKNDKDQIMKIHFRINELESLKLSKSLKETKSHISINGHIQFRTESATNQAGSDGVRQITQSFLRLRNNIDYNKRYNSFRLGLQGTKIFGGNDALNASTSGSTNQPEVDFYEAYYKFHRKDFAFTLGRQALAYGDHMFIGSLPWANDARSFDALKFTKFNGSKKLDLVYSKLSDNSTQDRVSDDKDLYMLYLNNKNLDAYFFFQEAQNENTSMLGFRYKKDFSSVFLKTENAAQKISGNDKIQSSIDFELGLTFSKVKTSLLYSRATDSFNQFYPTAHKFFGFVDVFGRRNIEQLALNNSFSLNDSSSISLNFHKFKKITSDIHAYKLNGSSIISSSSLDENLGEEVDFIYSKNFHKSFKVQLGYCVFKPGDYFDQNETTKFSYFQLNAKF